MICGGCNVRGVWEHRCHGRSCKCTECWCSCGETRPCATHDAATDPATHKTPLLLFHAWLERPPWNVTDNITILAKTREQALEILRSEVPVNAKAGAKFEDYKIDEEGEELEAGVVSQAWNGDRH